MKRLTDIINGWTFEETIKTAESLMEAEKNMFKWDVLRHLRDFAENYRERIKEFQHLEEQGRLLKLPCKVGDTVYVKLASYCEEKYAEAKVRDFTHFISCGFCVVVTSKHFDKQNIPFTEFGKTVFLTKSEAEAKLKELRHNND